MVTIAPVSQNSTKHKPVEELRLTLSSTKLKIPTNRTNWLILGQVNITELIDYGHKFGYYDWPKLDEVLILSQLTLSGREAF